jgi:molybdopterin converting factor small subunit
MPQAVTVRYYAQLREALKTGSEDISLDLPLDEQGILARLAELHPRQQALFRASRVAVADGYVDAKTALGSLPGGIDIISPISGG